MKMSDVLDQIKQSNNIETNTELASLLDINFRRIGEYYKGREPMDDDYPKIAMASGRRVDELQAIVKLASTNEKSREVWTKYYKSIGGIAAGFVMDIFMTVTFFLTPTPAQAAPVLETQAGQFVLCKLFERLASKARRKKAQLLRLAQMLKKANFTLLPARISQVQTV